MDLRWVEIDQWILIYISEQVDLLKKKFALARRLRCPLEAVNEWIHIITSDNRSVEVYKFVMSWKWVSSLQLQNVVLL